MLLNLIAIAISLVTLFLLTRKTFLGSKAWRATVTPLASIIGSGFLIIAPLLHSVLGKWALAGMIMLAGISYAIGAVIRYNILLAEPFLEKNPTSLISKIEKSSQLALGLAYSISVAFYINLFIAFIYNRIPLADFLSHEWAATFVLIIIMGITWWRGTKGLESIEIAAVTIKLSIIIGILFALAVYDGISGTQWFQHGAIKPLSIWDTFAMLAGMLMVTQGFETARFMGAEYSQKVRVNAVIYSQRISIVLYVLFIGLTCPIFLTFPILELNETAISQTLGNAIYIAPLFLLIAAISSQLSAALADTLGGGGLLKELIPSKVSNRFYYMAITFVALILTWTQNIFEIINLASKGFAIYYLLQVIIRMMVNDKKSAPTARYTSLIGNAALVLILMFVILWSIPAPHE